jgi:hypothetical protein
VRVNGSTSRGSVTLDHASVGPLIFSLVPLPEAGPVVEVHPVETSSIEPTLADTIPRRRNAAGPDGPRRKRPKPVLKEDPRTAAVQHNRALPTPCDAAESVTRTRRGKEAGQPTRVLPDLGAAPELGLSEDGALASAGGCTGTQLSHAV